EPSDGIRIPFDRLVDLLFLPHRKIPPTVVLSSVSSAHAAAETAAAAVKMIAHAVAVGINVVCAHAAGIADAVPVRIIAAGCARSRAAAVPACMPSPAGTGGECTGHTDGQQQRCGQYTSPYRFHTRCLLLLCSSVFCLHS